MTNDIPPHLLDLLPSPARRRSTADPKDSIPLLKTIKGRKGYETKLSRAAEELYPHLLLASGQPTRARMPAADRDALKSLLHSMAHVASTPTVVRNGIVYRRSYVAIPKDNNAFGTGGDYKHLSARAFRRMVSAMELLSDKQTNRSWVELANAYKDPKTGVRYRTRMMPLKPLLDWMTSRGLVFPWHPTWGHGRAVKGDGSYLLVNTGPVRNDETKTDEDEASVLPLERPPEGDEKIIPELNNRLQKQKVELNLSAYSQYGRLYDFGRGRPKLPMVWQKRVRRQFRFRDGIAGRLYGPSVQSVPADLRRHLHIDGQPTVELDYSSMQLVLLYAISGFPVPDVPDLYAMEGMTHSREDIKMVLTMTVGNDTRRSTISAISGEFHKQNRNRTGRAEKLYDEFWTVHSPANPHKVDGYAAWMDLQKLDSDIALRVLAKLLGQGIAAIPIHDSFIVQERHREALRQAMLSGFAEICPNAHVFVN